MAVCTMLTNAGLSEMCNAREGSMYIEILYWVGAFDVNLYNDFENNNTIHISAYTTPDEKFPNSKYNNNFTEFNEVGAKNRNVIYWNTVPSEFDKCKIANLYPNVTYSPVLDVDVNVDKYRGEWSSDVYPSYNLKAGDYWTIANDIVINSIFYHTGNKLIYTGSEFINGNNNRYRGNFHVVMSDKARTLYINKVGLYAVKRSKDGFISTDDPFLLGQVIIPNAQMIYPKSSSLETGELDLEFQIDAQNAMIDFEDIMFASQNDYWRRVTNSEGQYGLQHDGSIFIGNSLSIEDIDAEFPAKSDVGVAKALISTSKTVNKENFEEERDLPQLALQYIDTEDFDTESQNPITLRVRTTFRTTVDGNCEVDMYGGCSNNFGYYAITPKHDDMFGLGTYEKRWKSIVASDDVTIYTGDTDGVDSSITPYKTSAINKGSDIQPGEDIHIHTDYVGQSETVWVVGAQTTVQKDKKGIKISNRSLTSDIFKSGTTRWITITGGVLNKIPNDTSVISLRKNDFSAKYNRYGLGYFGNASIAVGPHYALQDIKKDNDGNQHLAFKPNTFYTYGNISNYIGHATPMGKDEPLRRSYPLNIRSSQDITLYTINEKYIDKEEFGYGESDVDAMKITNLFGELIVSGRRENKSDDSELDYVKGLKKDTTALKLFYNDNALNDVSTIDELREITVGSKGDSDIANADGVKSVSKDILLASSRYIFTNGDLVPIIDGLNDIGNKYSVFRTLHIKRIQGDWFADGYDRSIIVDGSIYPQNSDGDKGRVIGRSPINGKRFTMITADNIGQSNDYVNNIYSDNIVAKINLVEELLTVGWSSDKSGVAIYPNKLQPQTTGDTNGTVKDDILKLGFSLGDADHWIYEAWINRLHFRHLDGPIEFPDITETEQYTITYIQHRWDDGHIDGFDNSGVINNNFNDFSRYNVSEFGNGSAYWCSIRGIDYNKEKLEPSFNALKPLTHGGYMVNQHSKGDMNNHQIFTINLRVIFYKYSGRISSLIAWGHMVVDPVNDINTRYDNDHICDTIPHICKYMLYDLKNQVSSCKNMKIDDRIYDDIMLKITNKSIGFAKTTSRKDEDERGNVFSVTSLLLDDGRIAGRMYCNGDGAELEYGDENSVTPRTYPTSPYFKYDAPK